MSALEIIKVSVIAMGLLLIIHLMITILLNQNKKRKSKRNKNEYRHPHSNNPSSSSPPPQPQQYQSHNVYKEKVDLDDIKNELKDWLQTNQPAVMSTATNSQKEIDSIFKNTQVGVPNAVEEIQKPSEPTEYKFEAENMKLKRNSEPIPWNDKGSGGETSEGFDAWDNGSFNYSPI